MHRTPTPTRASAPKVHVWRSGLAATEEMLSIGLSSILTGRRWQTVACLNSYITAATCGNQGVRFCLRLPSCRKVTHKIGHSPSRCGDAKADCRQSFGPRDLWARNGASGAATPGMRRQAQRPRTPPERAQSSTTRAPSEQQCPLVHTHSDARAPTAGGS